MKNGGKRPGAGRPKGSKGKRTLEKEVLRGIFREVVAPEFEAMTRAQIAQAKGLSYLVTRDKRTGKFIRVGPAMAGAAHEETIEVWEKDPSTRGGTDPAAPRSAHGSSRAAALPSTAPSHPEFRPSLGRWAHGLRCHVLTGTPEGTGVPGPPFASDFDG